MAEKMTVEQQVKHFLTLAEDRSATQDERDLAAKQAERLMVKHAIERAMVEGIDSSKPREQVVVESMFIGGTYAYEVMLGSTSVARALGLQAYFTDYRGWLRHGAEQRKGVLLSVVGFESDVRDALVLLRSIETQALVAGAQWIKQAQRPYWSAADKYKARREFVEYFGDGAASRIREARQEESSSVTGAELVLVDRAKQVREHYETLGLRGRADRRSSAGTGIGAGYAAGREANVGSKGLDRGRGIER